MPAFPALCVRRDGAVAVARGATALCRADARQAVGLERLGMRLFDSNGRLFVAARQVVTAPTTRVGLLLANWLGWPVRLHLRLTDQGAVSLEGMKAVVVQSARAHPEWFDECVGIPHAWWLEWVMAACDHRQLNERLAGMGLEWEDRPAAGCAPRSPWPG